MNPVKIKVKDKITLYVQWDDNSESTISMKYLRNECPCASCKGETVITSYSIHYTKLYEVS